MSKERKFPEDVQVGDYIWDHCMEKAIYMSDQEAVDINKSCYPVSRLRFATEEEIEKEEKKKVLWLDDKRNPEEYLPEYFMTGAEKQVVWVKKYHEFVSWITENGLPEKIYFDHDLSDIHINKSTYKEKNGYDCALWLVAYCRKKNLLLPLYEIQSINKEGTAKINNILQKYNHYMQYPYIGIFKGENGSLGFQHGKKYFFKIVREPQKNILLETEEELSCEYQSMSALLNNWTLIGKMIPADYKHMTGFDTPQELSAYEKGRQDEEKVITDWITKWNGSTNSHMGQLLKDKIQSCMGQAAVHSGRAEDCQVPKEEIILTIKKIRHEGKWMEFWFEEDYPTVTGQPDGYHLSSKAYRFWEAVQDRGINVSTVGTETFIGWKIRWEKVGMNWEIKDLPVQIKKEPTKKEFKTCPDCGGAGRTGFHPLMKFTCSKCGGSGSVPTERD